MHSKMQTPEIFHDPSLIFSIFLRLKTCLSKKKKRGGGGGGGWTLKECIPNSLHVNSGEGVLYVNSGAGRYDLQNSHFIYLHTLALKYL